tara:strand:+ start:529 stop:798 length:270 start_codon:yes stop_codon:yes gene_type:complete
MTLKNRIKELEEQLAEAKKHTYIHETHTISCHDGELTIGYGDCDNEKWLVYNVDSLFKDLPFIIDQVCKQQEKMMDMHLEMIKKTLKEL